MRVLLFTYLVFLLAACGDRGASKPPATLSTEDTALVPPGADRGSPIDTDDNNKPGDGVTLDSPIGPMHGRDSAIITTPR